jgi:hypothetical protein
MESEPKLYSLFDAFSSREPVPTSLENASVSAPMPREAALCCGRDFAGLQVEIRSPTGRRDA